MAGRASIWSRGQNNGLGVEGGLWLRVTLYARRVRGAGPHNTRHLTDGGGRL